MREIQRLAPRPRLPQLVARQYVVPHRGAVKPEIAVRVGLGVQRVIRRVLIPLGRVLLREDERGLASPALRPLGPRRRPARAEDAQGPLVGMLVPFAEGQIEGLADGRRQPVEARPAVGQLRLLGAAAGFADRGAQGL